MLQDDTFSTFTTALKGPGTVDGTCRFQDFLAGCRDGPGWQGRQERRGIGIVASLGGSQWIRRFAPGMDREVSVKSVRRKNGKNKNDHKNPQEV